MLDNKIDAFKQHPMKFHKDSFAAGHIFLLQECKKLDSFHI